MSSPNDDAARLAEIRSRCEAQVVVSHYNWVGLLKEAHEDRKTLLSLLDAQQKQINGLQDYVWHRSYCPANEIPWGSHDCTCGLSALLKGSNP